MGNLWRGTSEQESINVRARARARRGAFVCRLRRRRLRARCGQGSARCGRQGCVRRAHQEVGRLYVVLRELRVRLGGVRELERDVRWVASRTLFARVHDGHGLPSYQRRSSGEVRSSPRRRKALRIPLLRGRTGLVRMPVGAKGRLYFAGRHALRGVRLPGWKAMLRYRVRRQVRPWRCLLDG
jgi:hypothetical protein